MLFSTYYRNVNPRNNVFIGCKLWKHFDKMSYCWHSNMMIWVEMGQYCFIWVNMALCYFVPFSWFLGRISVEYRGVCLGEKQGWFYFILFSGKQVKSISKSLQVNFMCIYIFFFKLTVHSHFLDAWSQSHNWVMGTHSSWLSCFLCGQLPLCSFQRCFKIVYEISICRHFTGND